MIKLPSTKFHFLEILSLASSATAEAFSTWASGNVPYLNSTVPPYLSREPQGLNVSFVQSNRIENEYGSGNSRVYANLSPEERAFPSRNLDANHN